RRKVDASSSPGHHPRIRSPYPGLTRRVRRSRRGHTASTGAPRTTYQAVSIPEEDRRTDAVLRQDPPVFGLKRRGSLLGRKLEVGRQPLLRLLEDLHHRPAIGKRQFRRGL